MSKLWILIVASALALTGLPDTAVAQVTPEQRRELNELSKEVNRAAALIRKNETEEATAILASVELKLKDIITAARNFSGDPAIKRTAALLNRQQIQLSKMIGKDKEKEPVAEISFMKSIAPLVVSRCAGCHGETNPRNGLRLDRFAGWRAGGKGGAVLVPEHPERSLIMARVNAAEGQGRMPANGTPLTAEEKALFANWVNQGAKFDGADETTSLADLIYQEDAKNVKIPKPKGGETVSFTRDIAPWFTNLCLNCHNSRRKSGGLSLETFFDIMKGGESGEVIIPGDSKNSRLFRLVGGLELPRMPQGQARITRKNYNDLVKWFEEGNVYDAPDPRTPIRTFVPSESEIAMQNFASMSEAEMQAHRQTRTEEQLRKTVSQGDYPSITTEHFLIVGNVEKERLEQVQGWAEEHLKTLQKAFENTSTPWRGRLAIFVLKDQFSYSEFNEVVERRRADPDLTGHSKVTAGQEEAYVALQDVGDKTDSSPGLQANVIDHLTGAYVQKSGAAFPAWIVRGMGLVMADAVVPDRQRTEALRRDAALLVAAVTKPEEIFANGTFSPSGSAAVGYTVVKFLLTQGGSAKFSKFIKAIEGGANVNAALQSAYGSPASTIASGYFSTLKSR